MLPKCARLLSGGRPSAIADAIRPSRHEGRLRAAARGVEEWPRDGSLAGPRRVRWADGELLDGAIDL